MSEHLTEDEARDALAECAREPVHAPGSVQPFAWLIACDIENGAIRYVSTNVTALLERELAAILGADVRRLLGAEVWHGVLNAVSRQGAFERRIFAATFLKAGESYAVYACLSQGLLVLELEIDAALTDAYTSILREQSFLVSQIETCTDQAQLFDLTTRLMRHLSGFDRVLIYRFDHEANGEVLAEARLGSLDPMLGLKFPSWDIPEQARDIMRRVPMRLISDVDQMALPIIASERDAPPLDLTLVQSRGVSPIHLQYMRNMGSKASMTLSVVLGETLWGMISFHHQRPRVAAPEVRQVLTSVLPAFGLKLNLLSQQATLAVARRIDRLQTDVETIEGVGGGLEKVGRIGPEICDVLGASGLIMSTGAETAIFGETPEPHLLDAVRDRAAATKNPGEFFVVDNLAKEFPDYAGYLNGVAGVVISVDADGRSLMLFRSEESHTVSWGGNPNKTFQSINGQMRLQPRSSFAAYLEKVSGYCRPWSDDDLHLAQRLWPLLNSLERESLMHDLRAKSQQLAEQLSEQVKDALDSIGSSTK